MQNQQNQLIQQEILNNIDQEAIAVYGLPTLKDIVEDYVVNLPQNFQYTVLNEENINFWTNDVMCILSELICKLLMMLSCMNNVMQAMIQNQMLF